VPEVAAFASVTPDHDSSRNGQPRARGALDHDHEAFRGA
jgi:hypothetical protein